ncbi:hypothetical protein BJ508DRAFT_45393 [Ascobolus immersus RN42]|uniref:Uncharacterized protein n=1 Tax=Ascobolus immersus RN42 TaxID=1160509 RepID=A0A3N4HIM9_ASCIM|nr:hypothetical protein BJ508DRAFT_45393 [Ascobolus immersus RN42]
MSLLFAKRQQGAATKKTFLTLRVRIVTEPSTTTAIRSGHTKTSSETTTPPVSTSNTLPRSLLSSRGHLHSPTSSILREPPISTRQTTCCARNRLTGCRIFELSLNYRCLPLQRSDIWMG